MAGHSDDQDGVGWDEVAWTLEDRACTEVQAESQVCQAEDQTDLVEVKKHMEPWAYQTDLVRRMGLVAEACCMQVACADCCNRTECEVARRPVAGRKGARNRSVVE